MFGIEAIEAVLFFKGVISAAEQGHLIVRNGILLEGHVGVVYPRCVQHQDRAVLLGERLFQFPDKDGFHIPPGCLCGADDADRQHDGQGQYSAKKSFYNLFPF